MTFMKIACLAMFSILSAGADIHAETHPRFELELEAGPVWQSYNDVEIPNDGSASRISLVDVVGKGPWNGARAYLTWNVNEKHGLRLLAAPLTIEEAGVLGAPVSFAGGSFTPGAVKATYQFDSYRLSYRYLMNEGAAWTWWLGFTAKIRDAQVALEQEGTRAFKDDLGFVPLLHVSASWQAAPDWLLRFDADALAGGPGRAEDVALKIERRFGDDLGVSVGYRLVEGGADVESVYTFAWLHYAVAAVRFGF